MSFDASPDLSGKKLQLLMEAVPGLARVALLAPASEPGTERDRWPMLAGQAKALNLEVREVEVQAPADLEAAVRRAKAQGAQALYVWPSNLARLAGRQLSDLALAHRLPSIHGFRESVVAGGLLSYAPSLTDIARHGAVYVDKILRGAMPNDLPVEQPTKFELVINLKTAKALGLRISPSLLLRADQVIE